ncbi:hypothetical protein CORC01_07912 [Colletotrichum orchidophilum]|uniref:Uncharacterized protein n=1 Tax=Colletotrichum orchidophilum TaxID=1209926 RepID=A0A1G4B620_9PEZI|nr:uncharacterized protein CORC01_07912 [Colletotrichum orchidophilum]OHE96766.1 hypothetical protein CORC01_07912 [Colletotrichum orchidophilum]
MDRSKNARAPNSAGQRRRENESTETVQRQQPEKTPIMGQVRSHKWLSQQRETTTEAALCPCVVYARTAERLERAAYGEDPLTPPSSGCSSPCWSCFLSSMICNWKRPLSNQRGDIRNRYAITGSADDDELHACAHPFWTLMGNHNEVLVRERICKRFNTYPFSPGPPPVEIRRFKAQPNHPYKSPAQMQMKDKSLPRIVELPESGCTTGRSMPENLQPTKTSPETSSQQPPLATSSKRKDTPVRTPDTQQSQSPTLSSQDPRVTVADFAEPHRLSHDQKRPVGAKQFPHTVHNDPLFGIAEEIHPHTVHEDPMVQVARRLSPHQINIDSKTAAPTTRLPHNVEQDPTVNVAGEPTQHSVHNDLTTKMAGPVHDHRLSQDIIAPVSTQAVPHSVHDDQTVGMQGPGQPASHPLSGDPTVKVDKGEPKQHAMHSSAATLAPENKKPTPHPLIGDIGRSSTAPAPLEITRS